MPSTGFPVTRRKSAPPIARSSQLRGRLNPLIVAVSGPSWVCRWFECLSPDGDRLAVIDFAAVADVKDEDDELLSLIS